MCCGRRRRYIPAPARTLPAVMRPPKYHFRPGDRVRVHRSRYKKKRDGIVLWMVPPSPSSPNGRCYVLLSGEHFPPVRECSPRLLRRLPI